MWLCARLSLNSLTQSLALQRFDLVSLFSLRLCVCVRCCFFCICAYSFIRPTDRWLACSFDRSFLYLFTYSLSLSSQPASQHAHGMHAFYQSIPYEYMKKEKKKEAYWSRTWISNSPFASLLVECVYLTFHTYNIAECCVAHRAHPYTLDHLLIPPLALMNEYHHPVLSFIGRFVFRLSWCCCCCCFFVHWKLCYLTGI